MTLPDFLNRDYKVGPDESLWSTGLEINGIPMHLLAGWRQTQGGFSLTRITAKGIAAKHVHTYEDETVYVLDGHITVHLGDKVYELETGDFLFQPRHVPHEWVSEEVATYLNIATPGGVIDSLWEELIAATESPGELTPEKFGEMYRRYGIVPLTDDGWTSPDSYGSSKSSK
jgi:quercetin dioxygenase-like cupin family protein